MVGELDQSCQQSDFPQLELEATSVVLHQYLVEAMTLCTVLEEHTGYIYILDTSNKDVKRIT